MEAGLAPVNFQLGEPKTLNFGSPAIGARPLMRFFFGWEIRFPY